MRNIVVALTLQGRELNVPWAVLPDRGVGEYDKDRPKPDVLVRDEDVVERRIRSVYEVIDLCSLGIRR